MTPRALLTAIGATAIAFAVAIGALAGSTATPTTTQPVAMATTLPSPHHIRTLASADAESDRIELLSASGSSAGLAWTGDCVTAL